MGEVAPARLNRCLPARAVARRRPNTQPRSGIAPKAGGQDRCRHRRVERRGTGDRTRLRGRGRERRADRPRERRTGGDRIGAPPPGGESSRLPARRIGFRCRPIRSQRGGRHLGRDGTLAALQRPASIGAAPFPASRPSPSESGGAIVRPRSRMGALGSSCGRIPGETISSPKFSSRP